MPDRRPDLSYRQRRAAQERLQIEPPAPEGRRLVVNEPRVFWAQRLDVIELGEKRRLLVADELRETERTHE